jgi:uncharacterized tellurite resistance protein B-like protein
MSLFRRVFNLDEPAPPPDQAVDPHRPLPTLTAESLPGETQSVHMIAAALSGLPPARARYVAAFAYLVGRAANANLEVSDAERKEMTHIAGEAGLDAETGKLVMDLASTLSGEFGATEDFLVTREFKAISTMEERHRLLRACFLVMAADDEIDATEAWLVNRVAEELDVERADLNRIREEFYDKLSGVRAAREVAKG